MAANKRKASNTARIGLRLAPGMRERIEALAQIRGQKASECARDIFEAGLAALTQRGEEA